MTTKMLELFFMTKLNSGPEIDIFVAWFEKSLIYASKNNKTTHEIIFGI
jgi:hypothetical protein